MKKFIKYALYAVALSATSMSVKAQSESGYFLDDYTYRYQMNPAMANSKGFVSIPVLGNMNMDFRGTLGVQDVLYNVDGKTTTFMNPKVTADEVMKNIGDKNRLGLDFSLPVVAVGFKALGGYNTVGVNVKATSSFTVPGSVFSLLKEGIENKNYEIANLKAKATSYIELQLGHSHQINSDIRIGANVKLLLGAANSSVDMRRADLTLGTDEWTITTDGEMSANMKGFRYETSVNDNTGHTYVSDIKIDDKNLGVSGVGFAADLGIVYNPAFLPDLTVSAAVLDLGMINWSNNFVASTRGVRTFTTDKYTFSVDDDSPNSFDNQWQKIKDDLAGLYELDDLGDLGSKSVGLGATANIGVEYRLPVYRALSFGLLNTNRIHGEFSWSNVRLSANWAPCKVFDAGVNVVSGTFGTGFGFLANLHVTGFNLFVGMDRIPGKLAKQGVPLNSNMAMNMGLNILF